MVVGKVEQRNTPKTKSIRQRILKHMGAALVNDAVEPPKTKSIRQRILKRSRLGGADATLNAPKTKSIRQRILKLKLKVKLQAAHVPQKPSRSARGY